MNPVFQIVLQVITFLVTHRDGIKQMILDLETLIPETPGLTKATAVKSFIANGLGIETQIETVWPLISPIFNAMVASTKYPPKAAEPAAKQ